MKPATTEDVLDLLDAHSAASALGAALELGLFWLLRDRPLSGSDIARTLGIPWARCRYWLQVLCGSGLLEEIQGGYTPSVVARRAILDAYSQGSWSHLAEEAEERAHGFLDLAFRLRDAGQAPAARRLPAPDYVAKMAEDAERARRFTRMLYEIHKPLADRLAAALDLASASRLLDLGGGSGVVSMGLLRVCPRLTAVVVDIPNVCRAGREIAAENGLEDRIAYHAADVLKDDLPSGFDSFRGEVEGAGMHDHETSFAETVVTGAIKLLGEEISLEAREVAGIHLQNVHPDVGHADKLRPVHEPEFHAAILHRRRGFREEALGHGDDPLVDLGHLD